MEKHKVLIIANHRPGRSPSQRFRFEQYLGFLEENGFDITFSYLLDEKDDQTLYSQGKVLAKAKLAHKAFLKRKKDLKDAHQFDIIFIHREAFLTAGAYFEKKLKKSGAKIIFDFDDAIWLPNVSYRNKRLKRLKNPSKTSDIIVLADMVFAGNSYLANYAEQFNPRVKLIPTTIDTDYHKPIEQNGNGKITIGWTGSHTTLKYLTEILPVFEKLKSKYHDKIDFLIICDHEWKSEGFEYRFLKWNRKEEIEQLNKIDIGIMPLVDDEWSKGKCGFKALQYMAIGKPTVVSPVGVNTEIVKEGENGYLANSEAEWFDKLSQLIENEQLRKELGANARKFIFENFSVLSNRKRYLNSFLEVLSL